MEIRIKNSQSIKEINFKVKGFTAIVGKSNIGKSAITRAVRHCFKNKGGIVRKGEKYAEVEIKDNDFELIWKKGPTKSYYKINGEEFDKCSRDVPDPILKAGFREVPTTYDKIEVLTNHQFYPLFLIDRKPREIAEIISSVSRLDVISKANKNCQKDLNSEKQKLKHKNENLKEVQASLQVFENFDEIKEEFTKERDRCKTIQSQEKFLNEVKSLNLKKTKLENQINQINPISSTTIPDVYVLEKDFNEYQYNLSLIQKRKKHLERINTLNPCQQIKIPSLQLEKTEQISYLKKLSKKYQKYNKLTEVLTKVKKLKLPYFNEEKAEKIKNIKNKWEDWQKQDKIIQESESNISEIAAKIKELESKLEDNIQKCPQCGYPLEEK